MFQKNQVFLVLWFILFLSLPTIRVNAYLDPGSGSLIIQVLIAGLLGVIAAVRIFKDSILSFLGFKGSNQEESDDEVTDHDNIDG